MSDIKTAVLLVNLGTPNSPAPKDVYRYLIEFLTDNRVIKMSWIKRQLLVRGIIVPFRFKQSAKSYQSIWTDEGSPLLVHGKNVKNSLQKALGDSFVVELAMRYQNPSIETVLNKLLTASIKHLIVIPLFPQYASATTGSVYQKVFDALKHKENFPQITFIDSFATNPLFIQAMAAQAKKHDLTQYDHFIFSFHGLPQSHLTKADSANHCFKSQNCCLSSCSKNKDCYSAQCHKTASLLMDKLQLPKEKTTLSFQSRLGKEPWLEPFTSHVIDKLAKENKKNVLVFCPSFICDCLETSFEISEEYAHEFKQKGGHKLDLVEGLNNSPLWIETLKEMVLSHSFS